MGYRESNNSQNGGWNTGNNQQSGRNSGNSSQNGWLIWLPTRGRTAMWAT